MNLELPTFIKGNHNGYSPVSESATIEEGRVVNDSKSQYKRYGIIFLLLAILSLISFSFSINFFRLKQSIISRTTPYKSVSHPDSPTPFWGTVTKPYPTGAFWTNFVIKNGDGAIPIYPYGVKAVEAGFQVSYGASRRIITTEVITDWFMNDLQISTTQSYLSRAVESYDNVSVTMGYKTNGNGKFRGYFVKGSPYVTVYFDGTTPLISSPVSKIIAVDSKIVKDSTGTQYIVTLGNYQKWFVYCSESVVFTWKDNTLTAAGPIHGIVRVAILPMQNIETSFSLLLSYAPKYPIGGSMSISYPTANQALVNIQYNTVGTGQLLMLALPHHLPLLPSTLVDSIDSKKAQSTYTPIWSIKGKLKPIVGDNWKLTYNLVTVGWNYVLSEKLTNTQLDEIAKYLFAEVKIPIQLYGDIYAFGKQIGRMARLALIADNLGIADARQQAIQNLETSIIPWLQSMNQDPFVYDKVYGGLVTGGSLADLTANFGAGWYSDHHFHFGYFVNAIAVLTKLDLPFYEANKPSLDAFVRDICNPDPTDLEYPFVRHKDFFDGHSWASGLFQQFNGKGQESSSEVSVDIFLFSFYV
jgi:endo-1,3(4)-beta-glucanase